MTIWGHPACDSPCAYLNCWRKLLTLHCKPLMTFELPACGSEIRWPHRRKVYIFVRPWSGATRSLKVGQVKVRPAHGPSSLKASPAPVGSGILGVMSFVGAGFGGRHALALEPAATKGGDPNDTYKRWFGCVSGRAGWGRGSSLVGTSCWPAGHRGMRAGSLSRARSSPTDGRSDAVAVRITLVRGQKRSGGKGGVQFDSALFLSLATVRLT
jgi:hypothetical protein